MYGVGYGNKGGAKSTSSEQKNTALLSNIWTLATLAATPFNH